MRVLIKSFLLGRKLLLLSRDARCHSLSLMSHPWTGPSNKELFVQTHTCVKAMNSLSAFIKQQQQEDERARRCNMNRHNTTTTHINTNNDNDNNNNNNNNELYLMYLALQC